MQASSGEQPVVNNTSSAQESSESDHDIHAVPDVELLQFQKQRSTPKVSLSEMCMDTGTEIYHAADIEFGATAAGTAAHMGMAVAGTEE